MKGSAASGAIGAAVLAGGLVAAFVLAGWFGATFRGVLIGLITGACGTYGAQRVAADHGFFVRLGLVAAYGAAVGLAAMLGGGGA